MSAAKRSRRRQTEARAASPLPASKRLKTNKAAHVPAQSGLGFLVDEDARKGRKLEARLTNGVPSSRTTRVDESHARVASDMKARDGQDEGSSPENAIGISSGEEESEDEEDGDDEENDDQQDSSPLDRIAGKSLPNGHLSDAGEEGDASQPDAVAGAEDVDMEEPGVDEEADEEPSFGDMLQARHPDPIDIQPSFPNPISNSQALVSTSHHLTTLTGTSLTTVLTQALKTNDKDLLETCFRTTDLPSIRATIQRLPSQHATTLLQRLAERIHKRPGRTGSLLVWVQWSLIAHGGYLAGQKDLMRSLQALKGVVRERASGLQSLLDLKGKLDLLSARLELRRGVLAASRAAHEGSDGEEDGEGVVYVEGEEEEEVWSDDEEEEGDLQVGSSASKRVLSKDKFQTATPRSERSDSDDESDDEIPNGVPQETDDESSQDEEEGLFNVDAKETSDDDDEEGDSDDEEDSDPESDEASDASSDAESDVSGVIKPAQPKTLNRKRG